MTEIACYSWVRVTYLTAHSFIISVGLCWYFPFTVCDWNKLHAPIPGEYVLWGQTTVISLVSWLQMTSCWLTSVSLRWAHKWCCPSVVSHCLSLCTVNTVTESWLHQKLCGHYIVTASVFTLHPSPVSSTRFCYLLLCFSVHQSLGIIHSLDAYSQKNTEP